MFRKITQKAKEAVGSTGGNYADEIKTQLATAKLTKKNLDELSASLAASQKQQLVTIETSKALAAEFGKFGDSLKESGDEHLSELVQHLATANQWQLAFAEMQASFKKACDEWTEEIAAYVNTSYAEAKKAEKAYDSARLLANAAADAVAKATKLDEKALAKANSELAVAQAALKDAQQTAADKLRYANLLAAVNLESQLRTYWNNVATHYKSGSQFLEAKRSTKEGVFASNASLKQDELARLSRMGPSASLKADGDKGLAAAAAKKPAMTPTPKPATAAIVTTSSTTITTTTTAAPAADESASAAAAAAADAEAGGDADVPIVASNPFAADVVVSRERTLTVGASAAEDEVLAAQAEAKAEASKEANAKLSKTNPFAF